MANYFGFVPSAGLKAEMEDTIRKAQSGNETLYPYRNQVALKVFDELINASLINMVNELPDSERKQSILKAANTVQSTVHKLLNQLLSKADNQEVMPSIDFLRDSLITDSKGQARTGFVIPDDLANRLQTTFAAIDRGEGKAHNQSLAQDLKFLTDLALKNYMTDFNKTLNLGMFKRTAASVAHTTIEKVLHVVVDKLIPSLNSQELQKFAAHYSHLLYQR